MAFQGVILYRIQSFLSPLVHHDANSRFDWLISGHQNDNPLKEVISMLSGKKQKIYACPSCAIQLIPTEYLFGERA